MAEEVKEMSLDDHLQSLKDNPPVEPNKEELEDFQYESAKASYDRAVEAWKAEIEKVERGPVVEGKDINTTIQGMNNFFS